MKRLSKEEVEKLKGIHDNIRSILIDYGNEEYGDCIIDEISIAVGILPTTVYYEEEFEYPSINQILEEETSDYVRRQIKCYLEYMGHHSDDIDEKMDMMYDENNIPIHIDIDLIDNVVEDLEDFDEFLRNYQ